MASKKRGKLEVINDILIVIKDNGNSIGPTKLQHQSNLSPQMFRDYVAELLEKGFLIQFESKGSKKLFSLTRKGFSFIEQFEVIQGFVDDFSL